MLNNEQLQRIRERLSLAQREAPDTIFLPVNISLSDLDILLQEMPKIVAEAMRRGEVKAWEEIVERVESLSNPFDKEWLSSAGGTHHAFETARSALLMEIDEKRKQLKLESLK